MHVHPRLVVIPVLALTVAAVVALIAFALLAGPSDGTVTTPAMSGWRGDGIRVARVHDAGFADPPLRAGDAVLAVDGVAVADVPAHPFPARADGDAVTYRVRRAATGAVSDSTVRLGRYPVTAAVTGNVPSVLLLACFALVGAYVFAHRPRDGAAWVLLAVAALAVLTVTSWPLGPQVIDLAGGRGLGPYVGGQVAVALCWAATLRLALLFPADRRARRPGLTVPAGITAVVLGLPFALYGARLTLSRPADDWDRISGLVQVASPATPVLPVVIVVVLALGYRRAGSDERATVLPLLWAMSVAVGLYLALFQLPSRVPGWPHLDQALVPLVFLGCPLALGAAVLRYRLFEIEVIVRRSLVHGAAYGLVAVVAAVALIGGDAPVGAALGRSRAAWFAAGVVVAAAFLVARRLVHGAARRFVYGARDDPYEVLRSLSRHLERTHEPEAVLPAMARTVATMLHLPYAAIELASPDGSVSTSIAHGEPIHTPMEIPLVHGGDHVGRLLLDVGARAEPFGPADAPLLDGLGRHIGAAAQLVLLNAALQRSVERLVSAREEERQRLAHDLHDGLGPLLGAGVIQLGVARMLVRRDPDAAEQHLDSIVVHAQEAIADIRRLVDDLRPGAIDQLGLVGAIEERATVFRRRADLPADQHRGAMDVSVEVDGELPDRLPAATEVAAYRITMEALGNASRHGRADHAVVRMAMNGGLVLEIIDDGSGLDPDARPGVGIRSMRERAGELGGSLTVERREPRGSVVRARLPVHPVAAPAATEPEEGT